MTPAKPPANWPFPTYKGQPLKPPARKTRKQRLKQVEDALL